MLKENVKELIAWDAKYNKNVSDFSDDDLIEALNNEFSNSYDGFLRDYFEANFYYAAELTEDDVNIYDDDVWNEVKEYYADCISKETDFKYTYGFTGRSNERAYTFYKN